MTTTNEWEEAARKAADDLQATAKFHEDILTDKAVIEIIAEHFAEIEAVFGKLVELAVLYRQRNAITSGLHNASLTDGIKRSADALLINQRIDVLEIDPQVKAAIERSKG